MKKVDRTSKRRLPKVSKVVDDPVAQRLSQIIKDLSKGITNARIAQERLTKRTQMVRPGRLDFEE